MYYIASFEKKNDNDFIKKAALGIGLVSVGLGGAYLATRGKSNINSKIDNLSYNNIDDVTNSQRIDIESTTEKDKAIELLKTARYENMGGIELGGIYPFTKNKFKYTPKTRSKIVRNRSKDIKENAYTKMIDDVEKDKLDPRIAIRDVNDRKKMGKRFKYEGRRLLNKTVDDVDLNNTIYVSDKQLPPVRKFNKNNGNIAKFEKQENNIVRNTVLGLGLIGVGVGSAYLATRGKGVQAGDNIIKTTSETKTTSSPEVVSQKFQKFKDPSPSKKSIEKSEKIVQQRDMNRKLMQDIIDMQNARKAAKDARLKEAYDNPKSEWDHFYKNFKDWKDTGQWNPTNTPGVNSPFDIRKSESGGKGSLEKQFLKRRLDDTFYNK